MRCEQNHQQVEEGAGPVALGRKALSSGEMPSVRKGEKTQPSRKESGDGILTVKNAVTEYSQMPKDAVCSESHQRCRVARVELAEAVGLE